MIRSVVIYLVLCNICLKLQSEDAFYSDLNSLSELPLDKLLHVKNSLERNVDLENENEDVEDQRISATLDVSHAQALHGKYKNYNQRGSYEPMWQKKGGKKGLSTIFQITITSLAFLAFAGYLLCLLVHAIKMKQNDTSTTSTSTAAVILAPIRRRKPAFRRTRAADDAVWSNNDSDPDSLYYALKMFSEGYVTYHTLNYKYYNSSLDFY